MHSRWPAFTACCLALGSLYCSLFQPLLLAVQPWPAFTARCSSLYCSLFSPWPASGAQCLALLHLIKASSLRAPPHLPVHCTAFPALCSASFHFQISLSRCPASSVILFYLICSMHSCLLAVLSLSCLYRLILSLFSLTCSVNKLSSSLSCLNYLFSSIYCLLSPHLLAFPPQLQTAQMCELTCITCSLSCSCSAFPAHCPASSSLCAACPASPAFLKHLMLVGQPFMWADLPDLLTTQQLFSLCYSPSSLSCSLPCLFWFVYSLSCSLSFLTCSLPCIFGLLTSLFCALICLTCLLPSICSEFATRRPAFPAHCPATFAFCTDCHARCPASPAHLHNLMLVVQPLMWADLPHLSLRSSSM